MVDQYSYPLTTNNIQVPTWETNSRFSCKLMWVARQWRINIRTPLLHQWPGRKNRETKSQSKKTGEQDRREGLKKCFNDHVQKLKNLAENHIMWSKINK